MGSYLFPQIVVEGNNNLTKVLLIFRDVERSDKVSVSTNTGANFANWRTFDVIDFSVENWEPSYDTELWKKENKLQLFVQKMGQGDGERLEMMEPQPVYILGVPTK